MVAVAIGLRRKGGEFSDEECIVVTVPWKRSRKRLKELRHRPLPAQIAIRLNRKVHRVPVDVQGAAGRKRGRFHGLVGCPLQTVQQALGMVGAVVRRGGQRFILTAAHVAETAGMGVQVQSPQGTFSGITSEVFTANNLDHALISPSGPLPAGAGSLPGGHSLSGVRSASTLELLEQCFFFIRNGQLRQVSIRKRDETVPFDAAGGETILHGVISTDLASAAGDSGTLLYDNDFLAVGTLLGEFAGAYSCFLPCQPSFASLGVDLA